MKGTVSRRTKAEDMLRGGTENTPACWGQVTNDLITARFSFHCSSAPYRNNLPSFPFKTLCFL